MDCTVCPLIYIKCLQVAVTTSKRGSWGYLYIKISPLQITHPNQERLATPPGSTSPTFFEQLCGFFYVPQEPDKWKGSETGPTVFLPYSRRTESLTICRCHYKGSTSSQSFKDPEFWSGPGVWTRSPAQQTRTLPTDPTLVSVLTGFHCHFSPWEQNVWLGGGVAGQFARILQPSRPTMQTTFLTLWTILRLCMYCTPLNSCNMTSRAVLSEKAFLDTRSSKSSPPHANSITR